MEDVATLPQAIPEPNAIEEGKSRYIAARLAGVSPRNRDDRTRLPEHPAVNHGVVSFLIIEE